MPRPAPCRPRGSGGASAACAGRRRACCRGSARRPLHRCPRPAPVAARMVQRLVARHPDSQSAAAFVDPHQADLSIRGAQGRPSRGAWRAARRPPSGGPPSSARRRRVTFSRRRPHRHGEPCHRARWIVRSEELIAGVPGDARTAAPIANSRSFQETNHRTRTSASCPCSGSRPHSFLGRKLDESRVGCSGTRCARSRRAPLLCAPTIRS